MIPQRKLTIDLSCIGHNRDVFATRIGGTDRLIPVLKADGYGLGAKRLFNVFEDSAVRLIAVSTFDEAIDLRESGCTKRILLFSPINSLAETEIQDCVRQSVEPTFNSRDDIDRLNMLSGGRQRISVHMNIESGMSRYGIAVDDADELLREVQSRDDINIASVYSHLPFHDRADSQRLQALIAKFRSFCDCACSASTHIASTAGALVLAEDRLHQFSHARIGLGLLGFRPSQAFPNLGLKESIKYTSRIDFVRDVSVGDGISYEHHFVCDKDSRIAVIPVGYRHGLPRQASDRLYFAVDGHRVPQVGRITMDSCMVDLSQCPDIRIGDEVTLLGDDSASNIYDWCDAANTIPWEILCRLGAGNAVTYDESIG